MPADYSKDAPKIEVSGISVEWNTAQGICNFSSLPVAMMWVDTTLASLMSGVQAMVGSERFALTLQSEGRKSVEADWQVISRFGDFREGFAAIARVAAVAGWGAWSILSLDEKKQECCFCIKDSWEGHYQKALGVCWGSTMLAGKMAGYCTKLFGADCWAEQTGFIARGDGCDKFVVRPSSRSMEAELEQLLDSDEATRADMAVALEKLKHEIAQRRQTETALRRHHDLLTDIVESAPIRIFWKNREGFYLGCNTLFAMDAGFNRPEELIGKDDFSMGWKEQAGLYRADDSAVMESGKPKIGYEEPQITPDGKSIWRRTSKVPLRDDDDKVIGILGIYEDVTVQKLDEGRIRLYQEIYSLSNDAIAIIRPDGIYIEQNRAHEELLGFSDEELKGKTPAIHFGEKAFSEIGAQLARTGHYSGEVESTARDGTVRIIDLSAFPIRDNAGDVMCYVGIKRDITTRIRVEKALQESEQRFRDLFDHSPDPCWIINEENLFVHCNQAAADILGYDSIEELKSTHPSKISPEVQPDGRESFEKANEMMAKAHEFGVHRFEWQHRRRSGECFPVDVTLARIEIDHRPQLYCIWRDISKRKQADRALKDSEERLRMAMEAAGQGWIDLHIPSGRTSVSPGIPRMMGYTVDEYHPALDNLEETLHPDDRQRVLSTLERCIRETGYERLEYRRRTKSGDWKWLDTAIKVIERDAHGNAVRLIGMQTDIDKRKETEGNLLASEADLKEAQRISHIGSWHVDLASHAVYWSEELYRIYGFDPSLPPPLLTESGGLFTRESWERLESAMASALETGESYELELEALTSSGDRKWILARGERGQDAQGNPIRLQGVVMDITERKLAEQALLQTRFVMDNAPYNITFLDEHANIRYLNKTARETFGISEEEVERGLKLPDIDPEVTPEIWNAHWADLKANKRVVLERTHQRRNGEKFPVEIIANYMQFGDQAFNATFDLDITERKEFEEQLVQAQKMEAIGTLVGGIAHDFNNTLAAIQGNLFLAGQNVADQPETSEKLKNIETLVGNAAAMVRQLLTFARKDRVAMRSIRLNAFMQESDKLTATAIPENIAYHSEICDEELFVIGDSAQLQQIVMNLLINARDAVANVHAPRIRCSLSRFDADREFIQRHADIQASHFACICVEDNGHGIARQHRDKIFDPFFTTKDVGKGTGLGLAMLFGAVKRHDGLIEVESVPQEGACFRIYLPLSEDKGAAQEPGNTACPTGNGEHILVVDDNPHMRSTTAEVLDCLGYQTMQAEDGRHALRILQDEAVDLMLSDVVMPVMGGIELLHAAQELYPALPAILATGYQRKEDFLKLETGPRVRIISKPFDIKELSLLIRAMLGNR